MLFYFVFRQLSLKPLFNGSVSPPRHFVSSNERDLWGFLVINMMDGEGGVYTNLLNQNQTVDNPAVGHAVLSESVGLMLEYADLANDKSLFDQEISLLTSRFIRNDTIQWVVPSPISDTVNSTVDNLRIVHYLLVGADLFHEPLIKAVALSIAGNLVKQNGSFGILTDSSDSNTQQPNPVVHVQFLDVATMQMLNPYIPQYTSIALNSKLMLQQALLPQGLYASSFNVSSRSFFTYPGSTQIMIDANMAEQLLCAMHALHAGLDISPFLSKLKSLFSANSERLFTTVDRNGNFTTHIESPAVYALAARLFAQTGNPYQAKECIFRLRSLQSHGEPSPVNKYAGGFIDNQTKQAFSFDQLESLITFREVK